MVWVGGGVVMSQWQARLGKPGRWRVRVAGGDTKVKALKGKRKRMDGDQRVFWQTLDAPEKRIRIVVTGPLCKFEVPEEERVRDSDSSRIPVGAAAVFMQRCLQGAATTARQWSSEMIGSWPGSARLPAQRQRERDLLAQSCRGDSTARARTVDTRTMPARYCAALTAAKISLVLELLEMLKAEAAGEGLRDTMLRHTQHEAIQRSHVLLDPSNFEPCN